VIAIKTLLDSMMAITARLHYHQHDTNVKRLMRG
jgi:hypothetical protein